jgi:tetratricopeptide (TPR) repeat protein
MTGARSYVVVGCVLAALAGSVVAQPARADRAKAASHFKQGQLYFKGADYERAISEYQTAYALSLEPLLLFNIALCNDRAQRPEKALEEFQRYLDLAPDGEVAEEAREDVVRLTPIVEEILAKRAAERPSRTARARGRARCSGGRSAGARPRPQVRTRCTGRWRSDHEPHEWRLERCAAREGQRRPCRKHQDADLHDPRRRLCARRWRALRARVACAPRGRPAAGGRPRDRPWRRRLRDLRSLLIASVR